MSNKAEEILGRKDNIKHLSPPEYDAIWKARQRGTMKINRFINNLFNNEYQTKPLTQEERENNISKGLKTPAQHLEDFVNQFKSIREPGDFELVKGGQIPYWYNEDQHENKKGTLGNSCMMYQVCQEYLNFYEYNQHKISMLIMKSKSENNKIIGRALVWKLDTPSGRTFMDRIYTSNDYDIDNFKKYAKDNGWLYKFKQNMESDEKIVDTVNNITKNITLIDNDISEGIIGDFFGEPVFPYLDTMKYYSCESKIISNKIESLPKNSMIYKLDGTEGTDYHKIYDYAIEELRERYADDVLSDLRYFVIDMYPDMFWNFIDDDRYIQAYIDDEINYHYTDFEYIFDDEDELIELIKNNISDNDKIPKNIDDLDISELHELVDKLNIKDEIVKEYVENRYKDYTAKEIHEEIYGDSNKLDNDIFDNLEIYFDEEGFVEEVANMEDEDELRERYPYEDE